MKVSEEIANKLFTNGRERKARRLVLELMDGTDGGGWCKKAVIDLIDATLQQPHPSDRK